MFSSECTANQCGNCDLRICRQIYFRFLVDSNGSGQHAALVNKEYLLALSFANDTPGYLNLVSLECDLSSVKKHLDHFCLFGVFIFIHAVRARPECIDASGQPLTT